MATGQGILDRLKRAKASADEAPRGVLPLVAFYGRDEEREDMRTRMYQSVSRVMNALDVGDAPKPRGENSHHLMLDMNDAVTFLNASSSPVEYLVSRGELELEGDDAGMGGMRFHTALRFRDLVNGAQVKGLKSPSLEGTGGGGGVATDIRGYQLDCINLIGKIRKGMPEPWIYPMMEAVVFMDEWLDLGPERESRAVKRETLAKRRLKTLHALHYALDRTGVVLGYMAEDDFMQRWPDGVPAFPPSVRRRSQESKAANQLALLTLPASRRA
ncbi:protein of unknown function [Pseudorhizobium banfieldiae]|uniref:Uncharacterized protein n=1 Tax=Pseudorhizobium banfieldiae TaxID=1125847 RepID=L0NDC3_9HYPH|nr:hypothetical protein [Pseudorhizobium banfieldiae]CAD6606022.1 hypothetical protein RNT25_01766 [arsenite-oxidising bacterium NT-25]CCF19113.1 protein of unknown function [Pseudorhizobium banfieldiae]